MDLSLSDLLLLFVVYATNILTFFIFVSRVKWLDAERNLSITTVILAIPTAVVASLNMTAEREWPYWVMPLVFVAWAILDLVVDIVRKQEFRQPRNNKILVPFLLLFYVGLGGMGALTWKIGLIFWVVTAATFALQFAGMAYAFRHGKA